MLPATVAAGRQFTVAVTDVRVADIQPRGLTASAYRVVVIFIDVGGITTFPPVKASYHVILPELAVAAKVTFPEPHTDVGVTDAVVTVTAAGWVTSMVPLTGPQLLASVMLYAWPLPPNTPAKMPVLLVVPLNV